jgi:serine/alanine adding enzyme
LPEAKEALFHYAAKIATEHNCDSIEFRNVNPLPFNLFLRTDKVNMHLHLTADPEELWKGFSATVRNQVRKAEKSGLVVMSGGSEFLDEFYRIYSLRMRQLGTPSYSKRLMKGILDTFPDQSRIFMTYYNGFAVGAGFTVRFGSFTEIPWAATLIDYNSLCPNNLLYWSIIKYYCLSGATCFDFGRCTVNSGTYKFKKQWGAEEVNMNFQYWVRPGHQFAITSPDNPKYKKKIEIWKKMPLALTNLIGPILSKNLP